MKDKITLLDSIEQMEEAGIERKDMVVLYNTYNFQEIKEYSLTFIKEIANTYDIQVELIEDNNEVIFYVVTKDYYEQIKKQGYVGQSEKYRVAVIKF